MVKSKTLLPNFLSLQVLNDLFLFYFFLFLIERKCCVPATQGLAGGST